MFLQGTPLPQGEAGGGMGAEIVISLFALLVSILSFALTYWHSQRSHKAQISPILVFLYDADKGWHIRNVGSGPALNVLVVRRFPKKQWREPVRIPPVSTGDHFPLHWMRRTNRDQLGVSYCDFERRSYTSECKRDLTNIVAADTLPSFTPDTIKAHWEMPERDE
jgi:hypothetical protein